ncbi:MFS general substrate transporter [Cylindrobasidium torrendii FP15055 ss-10]|uniref:MFS general substrate transporter n=1 Tax=Cylindrobasidium torrendii FP15055 ss-10 TaxID=1314674 RepID=A0A0D7BJP6_9AGAR|nr:MFS general substrate transporter [Cylindrobasidium torrendii FP15055 ss-10]
MAVTKSAIQNQGGPPEDVELQKLPSVQTADPNERAISMRHTTNATHGAQEERTNTTDEHHPDKLIARMHFSALCLTLFLEGWDDGTTGPLLPSIQEYYQIGFTLVSMLFISNCVGYVIGCGLNVWMSQKLGFGKTMVVSSMFQVIAYALDSPGLPFPVMVVAYAFSGFGAAIQDIQGNGFIGCLREHRTTKLSVANAFYGAGAFVAPLVSTKFTGTNKWSYFYLVSLGLAVLNTLVLALVFKGKPQEELLRNSGQATAEEQDQSRPASEANVYRAVLRNKSVHFMALFTLIYIGTTATLGGWIVTFINDERGGRNSGGYISSGFYGGITVGRLALIWVSRKIGEQRVVFLYLFLAIGLQITIWLVPSIIQNAVAISLVGVLLGPMFPITLSHATRILPPWLITGSVGWITGVGMTGSAALPFLTGLLASKYGIRSLQPLVVSMMCAMVGFWALVPRAPRRID